MTSSSPDDFSNWPPEGEVFALRSVDLPILPGNHPIVEENVQAIAANWAAETKANPHLFDGRMLLMKRLTLVDGILSGEGHVTPYSAFLWWRRQPARLGAVHAFAYAILATSDDALVAIRMGAHTANAGQVYFAAGSLEPEDIVGGRCDIEANIRREVLEETGLDLRDAVADAGFYATHLNRTTPIFKVYRFAMIADAMIERIEQHMTVAEDKEIAGAVAIRSADPSAYHYNASMLPIIKWYFSNTM